MNNDRRTYLLTTLCGDYITADALASALAISSKTIRNDIRLLNSELKDHGATIESKPKKGYRLVINDAALYSAYRNYDTPKKVGIPNTFDGRVIFIMDYLLNSQTPIKLDDLADMLYVSTSALTPCMKQVRTRLSTYNLQLIAKPSQGIQVAGNELDVRNALMAISSDWLFDLIDDHWGKDQVVAVIRTILYRNFSAANYQMAEVSFENLVTHIYIALIRIKKNQLATMSDHQRQEIMAWDEYRLAKSICNDLSDAFKVTVVGDEIAYIAVHLAAKKIVTIDHSESNVVISSEVYQIVGRMLDAVYSAYQIDLRDDLELRMMLALHLVPFGIRMAYDLVLHNPLLKDIKTNYVMAYNLAVVASDELACHYHKAIREDEIGYFALHFNLALERRKQTQGKKNILVVCSTGRGTAQLMKYQFLDHFGKYLNQIYTADVMQVESFDFHQVDYVITTVPIHAAVPVPILQIGAFMEEQTIKDIERFLNDTDGLTMGQYFDPRLFLTDIDGSTKEDVLKTMVDTIHTVYPDTPNDFYDAIMHRESLAVTEFGNDVAIPHPFKAMTSRTFVCIAILNKPIIWDKKRVQLVYLMSMENNPDRDLMAFYKVSSKLLVNRNYVHELIIKKDFNMLMRMVSTIEKEVRK